MYWKRFGLDDIWQRLAVRTRGGAWEQTALAHRLQVSEPVNQPSQYGATVLRWPADRGAVSQLLLLFIYHPLVRRNSQPNSAAHCRNTLLEMSAESVVLK